MSTGELVVGLCHQDFASLALSAKRPVPGGQLLIRLSRIAGGTFSQQPQPGPGRNLSVLGSNQSGHTSVGQPIDRDPPLRIGCVFHPHRINPERPAHMHTCQVDRHIAAAGGPEPAGEVHVPADLQPPGGKGWARAVAQHRPGTRELAADADTGQDDRTGAPAASSGEPASEIHGLVHLQATGGKGWARAVTHHRPRAVEVAADASTGQIDRTVPAAAGSGEPAGEVHVLADFQAEGEQGGTRAGEQLRPSQESWPPMRAPAKTTAPSLPLPVAVNPRVRIMSWPTCRPLPRKAGPEPLRSFAPSEERSRPPM
jgi:hypothetical protein